MTPYEYSARMDQILRYVGRLLIAPENSAEWLIGRTFALLQDSERLGYLRRTTVDPAASRREREIAWDLRAIALGWSDMELTA